uniref:Uncharacterized protein n=1 Tax=Cacopsylla melanoneura TaxID=428564 RepID=A0A8D8SLG8_9HEMI
MKIIYFYFILFTYEITFLILLKINKYLHTYYNYYNNRHVLSQNNTQRVGQSFCVRPISEEHILLLPKFCPTFRSGAYLLQDLQEISHCTYRSNLSQHLRCTPLIKYYLWSHKVPIWSHQILKYQYENTWEHLSKCPTLK